MHKILAFYSKRRCTMPEAQDYKSGEILNMVKKGFERC
jgi:hypothetical protein